jgi:hypothetical protein
VAAIANQLGVFYAKLGPNRIVYKSYKTIADLDIYPAHPSKDDFMYVMEHQKSQALEWANKYLGNLFSVISIRLIGMPLMLLASQIA